MSDIKNIEQHYSLDERPFLEKASTTALTPSFLTIRNASVIFICDLINKESITHLKPFVNHYCDFFNRLKTPI